MIKDKLLSVHRINVQPQQVTCHVSLTLIAGDRVDICAALQDRASVPTSSYSQDKVSVLQAALPRLGQCRS